jgi:L-alanine-DL-glutamate epimerase-like enolase superfamily enzyme
MASKVGQYFDEGYRVFQLKVGGKVQDDIARIRACRQILDEKAKGEKGLYLPLLCDANTGWRRDQAMQVINGVKDLDVYIEQPCETYEECLSVRQHCPLPFVIDESMDNLHMLTRIMSDRAADVINIKISKVGGLTKARQIRDLAVSAGKKLPIVLYLSYFLRLSFWE